MCKLLKFLFLICFSSMAVGCANGSNRDYSSAAKAIIAANLTDGEPVFFYDRLQDAEFDSVKMYIDRRGDLYPDRWSSSGTGRLVAPDRSSNPYISDQSLRYLMSLELTKGQLCDDVTGAAQDMCNTASDFSAWKKVQSEMWLSKGAEISRKSVGKTVVLLVHGFNVAQGDADFRYAKKKIFDAKAAGEELLFVEIHWDGGQTTSSWNAAQYSGQLVGINLRQLLNGLIIADASSTRSNQAATKAKPIRIVTHSSGAFVIAALLGDSRSPNDKFHERRFTPCPTGFSLPQGQNAQIAVEDYNAALSQIVEMEKNNPNNVACAHNAFAKLNYNNTLKPVLDVPQTLVSVPEFDDIRVLMLAAATPSNSFSNGVDRRQKFNGMLSPNVKLLIAVNNDDSAINKHGFGPTTINTSDTTLGAREKYFCMLQGDFQAQINNRSDRGRKVYGIDFNRLTEIGRGKQTDWREEQVAAIAKVYPEPQLKNLLLHEALSHSWPLYMDQAAYSNNGALDLFMTPLSGSAFDALYDGMALKIKCPSKKGS